MCLTIVSTVNIIDLKLKCVGLVKYLPVYAGGHFGNVFKVADVERGPLSVR